MVIPPLSLSALHSFRTCTRQGWFARRGLLPSRKPNLSDDETRRIKEETIRFDVRFTSAVNLADASFNEATVLTVEYLKSGRSVIDGAIVGDGLVSRPALLQHVDPKDAPLSVLPPSGTVDVPHAIVDVFFFSALADPSDKGVLTDLAFDLTAIRKGGFSIRKILLLSVDPSFRRPTGFPSGLTGSVPPGLIVEHDVTSLITQVAIVAAPSYIASRDASAATEVPPPTVSIQCKKCPLMGTEHCHGANIAHPLWELPRTSSRRLVDIFMAARSLEIADIPRHVPLKPLQARVRRSVQVARDPSRAAGAADVSSFVPGLVVPEADSLAAALGLLSGPVVTVDFEALNGMEPLDESTAPYELLPCLFVAHTRVPPGSAIPPGWTVEGTVRDTMRSALRGRYSGEDDLILRYEASFPFDSSRVQTQLRVLFEALLHACEGANGSIVCYGEFEEQVLREGAFLFPDLHDRIMTLVDRLYDLQDLIRTHAWHAEFRGKSGLKTITPIMLGTKDYDETVDGGSGVVTGEEAARQLATMADVATLPEERERVRREVLHYCAIDSRLLQKLLIALNVVAQELLPRQGSVVDSAV